MIYYLPFSVQLISLSMILSTSNHCYKWQHFILFYGQYSFVYVHHSFLIQSSVDRHLGCFHVFATINSTVMNTRVYVSFKISVFNLFNYISRSRIAGSSGSPGGAC